MIKFNKNQYHTGSVNVDTRLFAELGRVDREYSIKLKEAVSYAIHVPRLISFPLRSKANRALKHMVADEVIKSMNPNEPKLQCAPMVGVSETHKDEVRIVSDFTELNKFIK